MSWKLIDLFSGAGGMSLGFVDRRFCGGFESVLAVDNDAAAIATHKANFSGEAVCGNIETWLADADIPKADVVIGGPPCQGFSLLNKKRDGDARRALWEPFLDVAARSGARVFIMENVAELFRSPELDDICQRHVGAFSSGPLRNGLKRPTKVSGTPENRRDDPERSKGQIPRISAGFIDYLGEREKNKWCPEEDSHRSQNVAKLRES